MSIQKNLNNETDEQLIKDIETYLKSNLKKPLLRFITCGSVDDGKSTILGRLLYEGKQVFEDQVAQLRSDSAKMGTQGKNLDFSLLLDGLKAEREQGITIDVAYRFFDTSKKKFIVADTPGHEQYTRNMITAASTADLAIILVDARNGILLQTKRHTYLCSLLGVKNYIIAINKMDLVNYKKDIFDKIAKEFAEFAESLSIKKFTTIPVSGLKGDNVTKKSKSINWYEGGTLLDHLEKTKNYNSKNSNTAFRMPVQWVNRPHSDFRGFSGTVVSGSIRLKEKVRILPAGQQTKIKDIFITNKKVGNARAGDSITLTFEDELDCSRGQIITSAQQPLEVADQFEATVIWMDEQDFLPGRSYFMKIGAQTVSVTMSNLKHKININTMEKIASKQLKLNEIGVVHMIVDQPIPFTAYKQSKELGGFIVIDKISNFTVGAGLINFALRRANNIHWQATKITREDRAEQKGQKAKVIWMTGLSGSGKSTIANTLEQKLRKFGYHTFILDGDNVRHGLNKDLGFKEVDRIENIRRVGEVAKLMTDAGLIVIAAFISPFKLEREMVRKMMESNEFFEVHIDTPLAIAEQRDVKGLYAKARKGELKNFTGIDSPYEPPQNPEIHIKSNEVSAEEATDLIIKKLFT